MGGRWGEWLDLFLFPRFYPHVGQWASWGCLGKRHSVSPLEDQEQRVPGNQIMLLLFIFYFFIFFPCQDMFRCREARQVCGFECHSLLRIMRNVGYLHQDKGTSSRNNNNNEHMLSASTQDEN